MYRISLAAPLALLVAAVLILPELADAQDPQPRRRAAVSHGNLCGSAPRDMVCVTGGSFRMGSTVGDYDELPVHSVTISEFLIDKTEVSFGQYMQCVQAQRCKMPRYYPPLAQRKVAGSKTTNIKRLPKHRRRRARKGRRGEPTARPAAAAGAEVVKIKVSTLLVDSKLPVAGITWFDARNYCTFRGRHLPTEAQWEYAARGSAGNYYAWGSDPPSCDRANTSKCGQIPKPVNSLAKGASPFGALNMTGNVWEWVNDWYDGKQYASPTTTDPVGPTNTEDPTTGRWAYRYRVLRGGSWSGIPNELRTSYRYRLLPSMYANDIGFRCAKSNVVLPTQPSSAPAAAPASQRRMPLPSLAQLYGPRRRR